MKAIPAEILANNNNNIINGKINKPHNKTRNIENEEIQMYLSKLKDLVPFMPKNKKLSKLEVIHYVIEYICDLQYALETHPTLDSSAVESAAIAMLSANAAASQSDESEEVISRTSSNSRQPLGVLIPNPIVKSSSLLSSSDVSSSSSSISDKVSSSSDSRSVSV
uniref:Protein extra-macrochaetae n=1 Tax=Cacopsylla melanoneura TaxID=428564 RepID=A0A8D8VY35_9HEMI